MRIGFNGPTLNYATGIEIGANPIRAAVLGYGCLRHTRGDTIEPGGHRAWTLGVDILEPLAAASAWSLRFGDTQEIQGKPSAQTSLGLPPSTMLTGTGRSRSSPLRVLHA